MASGEGASEARPWDEVAAGTAGDDAPVGVGITLTQSTEPPDT